MKNSFISCFSLNRHVIKSSCLSKISELMEFNKIKNTGMNFYGDLLGHKRYWWLFFKAFSSNVQNRPPQVPSPGKIFLEEQL